MTEKYSVQKHVYGGKQKQIKKPSLFAWLSNTAACQVKIMQISKCAALGKEWNESWSKREEERIRGTENHEGTRGNWGEK